MNPYISAPKNLLYFSLLHSPFYVFFNFRVVSFPPHILIIVLSLHRTDNPNNYKLSSAVYICIIGIIHAAISPPTTTASTMMIIGAIAAIRDCTDISTSSS